MIRNDIRRGRRYNEILLSCHSEQPVSWTKEFLRNTRIPFSGESILVNPILFPESDVELLLHKKNRFQSHDHSERIFEDTLPVDSKLNESAVIFRYTISNTNCLHENCHNSSI